MRYEFKTRGTCASRISFTIEDGILSDVVFTGGCNGNLKAISKLIDGKKAAEVAELLRGNTCGRNPTSCADQLSIAITQALKEANE